MQQEVLGSIPIGSIPTSPKVFKGAELELDPGASATVRRTVSGAQHSTRKHYPREHRIEVLLNGRAYPGGSFEIAEVDGKA